jgi:PAS domain S-box-containing protein
MTKDNQSLLYKIKALEKENKRLKHQLSSTKKGSKILTKSKNEELITRFSTRFIFSKVKNIDRNIFLSLKELSSYLKGSYAYLFIMAPNKKKFSDCFIWSHTDNKSISLEDSNFNIGCIPNIYRALVSEDEFELQLPEQMNELSEKEHSLFSKRNIFSGIMLPIKFKNDVKGFIGLDCEQQHRKWRNDEKYILKITGQVFINSIERKHSELNLQESEEKYRLLVEQQSDLIIKFDTQGRLLFVSPSYCRMFGKTADELLGKAYMPLIHEHDREQTAKAMESLYKAPYACYVEHRAMTTEGWKWLAWSNIAITDRKGKIKEIIGQGRDVDSRKSAQLTLQRHVQEMDVLNRFLRRLSSSLTVDDVAKASIETMSKSFDNTLVAFYVMSKGQYQCKMSNIAQFQLGNSDLHNPILMEEIQNAMRLGKVVFYEDNTSLVFFDTGEHSLAVIPCTNNNEIASCLVLCIFNPDYTFSEHLTFLETLSNEISVSLQNAILYEEIKIHSNELFKANKDLLLEIAEREKAEKALKESGIKFRNLFENAADGIIIFDDQEMIHEVNDSFCKLIGKEKDDLKCQPFSSLFVYIEKDDVASILTTDNNLLKQNLIKSNGQTLAVEIHIKPLGTNKFQAFFRDVTERNYTEQKLIETNNLLKAINNASPDVIFIMNVHSWKFTFFNRRFTEVFQYTEQDLIKAENVVQLLIHPDDERIAQYHFSQLLNSEGNKQIETEVRLMRKDKKVIWSLMREQVFTRDTEGHVIETVGVINDISERKKAEQEIILTNNFLQAIFHTSPDVIYVSDYTSQNIFYISRKIENVSLYSLQHCINSKNIIEEILYEEDRSRYYSCLDQIKKLGKEEPLEFEFRLVRKDKNLIWVRVVMIIFKSGEKGEILQTLGILSEITERKTAHQRLIESETKFRNIFNTSTDGIAILDHSHNIIEANESFINLAKTKKQKLFKIDFIHLFEDSMQPKVAQAIQKCIKGKPGPVFECELKGPEGPKVPIELEFKNIEFEGKKAILALIHDITERKEAEKKVFDAIILTEEKERETFAKNLHDDLGPLLSSIRMYLNSFQDTEDKVKQAYIVQQVNGILKEAIQTTKEVSNDLSPHVLTNYGLVSAIESFISNFSDLIQIHFITNIKNLRFDNSIEMSVFRITKELINNTIKHSGSTKIDIMVNYSDGHIKMTYRDNGRGFDFERDMLLTSGMGIFNIKNRIKTLNGSIFFSDNKPGIKIEAHIPAAVKPDY